MKHVDFFISFMRPDLEAVIASKYIGIDIQFKGRNLIKEGEVWMIKSALKYSHTIKGFSRVGQDKAQVASLLWERCAVPAILYATEAMNISKTTIAELNRIQNLVDRFILQLPKSAAIAAVYVDGGMKPMDIRIQERTCIIVWKANNSSEILKYCPQETSWGQYFRQSGRIARIPGASQLTCWFRYWGPRPSQ